MSLRLLKPLAVCLALAGQVAGAVGVPVVRGSGRSAQAPDAACGCCPADRAARRCCCSQRATPAEDLPPCCRGKKVAASHTVTWVVPSLRARCVGPHDTAPGSVLPVSVPPAPAAGWRGPPDEVGFIAPVTSALPSRSVPPDDPPPRGR